MSEPCLQAVIQDGEGWRGVSGRARGGKGAGQASAGGSILGDG